MRTLVALLLASLLPVAGCRDNGITDPVDAAAGSYSLVELNGSALPIPAGQQAEVVSGYLTLRRDSSYVVVINTQVASTTGPIRIVALIENGTFSADGNALQFRPAGGGTYNGTRDGNTLSYEAGGMRATYRKRLG